VIKEKLLNSSATEKILELLVWVKESGLWPESFGAKDLFINPTIGKISFYGQLLPHQKAISLWIPSKEKLSSILKARGLNNLQVTELEGFYFAHVDSREGAMSGFGVGRREALLSLLHHLRRNRPALTCS